MADRLVDVSGLAKLYADGAGASGVGIAVSGGDLVGLIGANGGGKTTTLQMLAGLILPHTGEGTVLGDNVMRAPRNRRARLGYMPQRLVLYPDLTVRENLAFRLAVFAVADRAARMAALVETYGLAGALDRRVGVLSGGWARRAQFAATVAHDPSLLLLDEPTAGLDAVTRRDLWHWLDRLAANGCGVIVATHDLAEAERFGSIVLYEAGHASPQMRPDALAAAYGGVGLEAVLLARADTSA